MSASVLVVDDDGSIRRMLERTLAADGYVVAGASDGGAALAAVERAVPDLLVLDVGLPGVDGLGRLPPASRRRDSRCRSCS